LGWARRLRQELGAVPVAGEALEEFRYLLLYVGTVQAGSRLELIEPAATGGFLARFLQRHGAGTHHITFTVPDLRSTVAQVRDLGATVVGEEYTNSSWREAFLMPDDKHGVVIQLAQTDFDYPPPAELLDTNRRDVQVFPSSYGATEPLWWTSLWDTPRGEPVVLGATHLASTDLDYTRDLFGGLLGADVSRTADGFTLVWPGGSVQVHRGDRPGVQSVDLHGAGERSIWIGKTPIGGRA
jgi:hypothetical protein